MKIMRASSPASVLETLDGEIRADYLEMYNGDEEELGDFPVQAIERNGELYVALTDAGDLMGCGGWVWVNALGYTPEQIPRNWPRAVAEVKRVFVRQEYRRQGVASAIDRHIFEGAFAAGADLVVGETGRAQLASQAMRIGQKDMIPVEPFGKYHRDLGSLFFGKWRD